MSTRERWIVYPLLFLALGLALRDKVYPPSKFTAGTVRAEEMVVGKIRCNFLEGIRAEWPVAVARLDVHEMTVSGPHGARRAWLGAMENQSGQVELYGREGKPVLVLGANAAGEAGLLEAMTADGSPQVLLDSVNGWGRVSVVGPGQQFACTLGNYGGKIAVFAEAPQKKRVLPLTETLPVPPTPARPQPGGKAKP